MFFFSFSEMFLWESAAFLIITQTVEVEDGNEKGKWKVKTNVEWEVRNGSKEVKQLKIERPVALKVKDVKGNRKKYS